MYGLVVTAFIGVLGLGLWLAFVQGNVSTLRKDVDAIEQEEQSNTGVVAVMEFTGAFTHTGDTVLTVVENLASEIDTADAFNNTTFVYTVPTTGYYRVSGTMRVDTSGGGNTTFGIYRNDGTAPITGYYAISGHHPYGFSTVVSLTADDTLYLGVQNTDAGGTAVFKGDGTAPAGWSIERVYIGA